MNKNHVNLKGKLWGKLGFDFIPKKKQEIILATDILQSWFVYGNPGIPSQNTS
jgi:hypothetical protein